MKPVRGRPKREESLHRIYLCKSTFQRWNERKVELGFEKDTNNQFTLFLLNLSVDPSKGAAETEEEILANGLQGLGLIKDRRTVEHGKSKSK